MMERRNRLEERIAALMARRLHAGATGQEQDAELKTLTARANLAHAQRDYRVARVALDWVAGTSDSGATQRQVPSSEQDRR